MPGNRQTSACHICLAIYHLYMGMSTQLYPDHFTDLTSIEETKDIGRIAQSNL
jgi:hypothetical protein